MNIPGPSLASPVLPRVCADAVQAAGGDRAWAEALLGRWIEQTPGLQQQVVAWGCERGWWTPASWGRENGLWELAIRCLVASGSELPNDS